MVCRRGATGGFSLVELLAAIAIVGLVVIGVAYMLSTSRSFIDRYALARDATARVEQRLELLQYPAVPTDTTVGTHVRTLSPPLGGAFSAQERVYVSLVDDPIDGTAGNGDPRPQDYKAITVTVAWTLGAPDSVSLTSFFAVQ